MGYPMLGKEGSAVAGVNGLTRSKVLVHLIGWPIIHHCWKGWMSFLHHWLLASRPPSCPCARSLQPIPEFPSGNIHCHWTPWYWKWGYTSGGGHTGNDRPGIGQEWGLGVFIVISSDSNVRGGNGFEDRVPACQKWEMHKSYNSWRDWDGQ